MDVLSWIVLGLVAGVIANFIDPQPAQGGMLGAIVLGILGAVVGGYVSSYFLGVGVSGMNLSSLVVAVVGSLLLLLIGRMIRRTA